MLSFSYLHISVLGSNIEKLWFMFCNLNEPIIEQVKITVLILHFKF